MKQNLVLIFSVCCACAVATPNFAADTPQQTAAKKAEAEKKAKEEAEKKAKAEAEKKAKEEAEKKAREEARKNFDELNKLAKDWSAAFNAKKYDDAAAIAKKAQSYFGKPGCTNVDANWYFRCFNGNGINMDRIPAGDRPKVLPMLLDNYKFLIAKANGDRKADFMNDYINVLKTFVKPVPEKDIAALKADRFKVEGITQRKVFQLLLGDWEIQKADAVADTIFNAIPADKLNDKLAVCQFFINAYASRSIYGSKYAAKWYEKAVSLASGDNKSMLLSGYAAHLEKYALAADEEIAKIRKSAETVPEITQTRKFNIALSAIHNTDTDEVFKANIQKALELAGSDIKLRITLYRAVFNNGWNAPAKITDKKFAIEFLKKVVLVDKEVITLKAPVSGLLYVKGTYLGEFLKVYANYAYDDFRNTENYLMSFYATNKDATASALLYLYEIAAHRYCQVEKDQVICKKILAIHAKNLAEAESNLRALEKAIATLQNTENDREKENAARDMQKAAKAFEVSAASVTTLRHHVANWAFEAKEYKVLEQQLEAVAKMPKPDLFFLAFHKAKLAYVRGQYADAAAAFEEAFKISPNQSFVYYDNWARALTAIGEYSAAADVLEKNLHRSSWSTGYGKNYYTPRIAALRARAAKKAEMEKQK